MLPTYDRVRLTSDGIEYETGDPVRVAQLLRFVAQELRADRAMSWTFATNAGVAQARGYEWWFTGREDTEVTVTVPRDDLPEQFRLPPEDPHGI